MSNVVKIYHDLSDVGNHENHIKKLVFSQIWFHLIE